MKSMSIISSNYLRICSTMVTSSTSTCIKRNPVKMMSLFHQDSNLWFTKCKNSGVASAVPSFHHNVWCINWNSYRQANWITSPQMNLRASVKLATSAGNSLVIKYFIARILELNLSLLPRGWRSLIKVVTELLAQKSRYKGDLKVKLMLNRLLIKRRKRLLGQPPRLSIYKRWLHWLLHDLGQEKW